MYSFNPAFGSRLFQRFAGCALAGGEIGIDASFGKGPFAGGSVHEQEFDCSVANAITNCGNLHRQAGGRCLWKGLAERLPHACALTPLVKLTLPPDLKRNKSWVNYLINF